MTENGLGSPSAAKRFPNRRDRFSGSEFQRFNYKRVKIDGKDVVAHDENGKPIILSRSWHGYRWLVVRDASGQIARRFRVFANGETIDQLRARLDLKVVDTCLRVGASEYRAPE